MVFYATKKGMYSMQITNNYLISKLYFQNAQKKQKKAKNDVGFGKVIGQKDNLFNVIGMKRTAIVDKISDDAGLDVLVKREYYGGGAFVDHAYIIPSGTGAEPDKYDYASHPVKENVGWLIPKGYPTMTLGKVKYDKNCITVLSDCEPSIGTGYDHDEMSLYINIMHQLCTRFVEKEIIERTEHRKFDFGNRDDAYESIDLPIYTQTHIIKAFSSQKWPNRKNLPNLKNASVATFRRVISAIVDREILLRKQTLDEDKRYSQGRKKEYSYTPDLFNDEKNKIRRG